jgi:pyruvate dehydrogenase complex dehydrogenase (E1) component
MADMIHSRPPQAGTVDVLGEIERQVLWLSTAIIHYANRVRPNPSGIKVGGHQASSASMVSIMTSLWFRHLRAQDRVLDLSRDAPAAVARVVTVSPDVSSSTNLGGWVNKVGVWSAHERTDWFADDAETILHWREKPTGQHIELGIAETNLVGLIGELGATWSRWGQPLLPIGVLYDPFVERALEPWSFGIYAGGQSILVGTPSGVSLAPEGGAHQSVTTPSIGIEQPGCVTYEPAFAVDTEWCLLASLARLGRPDGGSAYLRLSTRPVSQKLADVPADPAARERRRRMVAAGAYPLRRAGGPLVTIAAVGAVVPEALAAAERLSELGAPADVVVVTSPGLLFRALRARQGRDPDGKAWILDQVFPAARATPGDRPGRAPAHAGLPGHREPRPARRPRRRPVRAVRVDRGPVPVQRDRHRQHHPRRPGPHPAAR